MLKYIGDADVKGKVVLLREDLNSDVIDGKVLMSERIKQSASTIKMLQGKGAKVVVIAHQGRKGEKDFVPLEQHAGLLNQFVKIKFIPDITGKHAKRAIRWMRPGRAILLDNIRNLNEEMTPGKNDFSEKLSSWCKIYVNDAFSVSHRAQTSVVTFPSMMESYIGPLMKKELDALGKISLKDCLYILAGAKPEEDLMLLNDQNKTLTCGLFGQLCTVAKGADLGAQNKYLQSNIADFDKNLQNAKDKVKSMKKLLITPSDFAVKTNGARRDVPLKDFPVNDEIFDIGPETQKIYAEEIKNAKAIYMKGPAGYYTDDQFFHGTMALFNAIIANTGAFSVLGGGQLSNAVAKSKIPLEKFGYISLSGGALLEFIAGKKLPGLEALGYYSSSPAVPAAASKPAASSGASSPDSKPQASQSPASAASGPAPSATSPSASSSSAPKPSSSSSQTSSATTASASKPAASAAGSSGDSGTPEKKPAKKSKSKPAKKSSKNKPSKSNKPASKKAGKKSATKKVVKKKR